MRSYLASSLVIAFLVASGCGEDRPGTDARDGSGDGSGDRVDMRIDTSGTGGAAGSAGGSGGSAGATAGTGGSTAGSGGSAGTGGSTAGSGGSAGNDGGAGTGGGGAADAGPDASDGGNPDGAAPTCTDRIKNSDETGVDCGGHCGKCAAGNPCLVTADCQYACKADKTCAACNVAADCPGTESECEHRTCTAGACGNTREAAGTVLTTQTTGDCKRRQCAANGTVASANDDTDVPDDRNPCTNDICTSGTASHTMMPANSNCGGANHCNDSGQCVGCAVAADCPGTDTACRARTCSTTGVCGFSFTASGTKLVDPTASDCKGLQCDGNGNSQVVNDNADLPVDGNVCTTDECSSGTPSHRPVVSGTTCGGSLVCDGASHCVECLSASSCPGTDADCHTRSCVSGQCGISNTAAGTLIAAQTARDCKKNVCNGQGGTSVANDDLDLPVDGNACTQDVCTAGTPSNPFVTAGNSCGASTICDGQGACVVCVTPSTCPGTDTDCHHRTCIAGACGIVNTADGTAVPGQTPGDCKRNVCMAGAQMTITDNADLPVDGNLCTGDMCANGVPSNPFVSSGTGCGTSLMCNGQGACVGCITAANCGANTTCQTHTCSAAGVCGVTNAAVGTLLPGQTPGDCKKVQCDGAGQPQTVNDNTDVLVDNNACTQDLCNTGIPSNPPETAGTTCSQNGGNRCNGSGTAPACVQCNAPTDCTGTDTECHHRTCSAAGVCGISNTPDGTAMSGQTPSDCKKNVCMTGAPAVVNDNTDVLVDNNSCTMDLCNNGTPSNPTLTANAPCSQDGGTRCNGIATAPACVQCLNDGHCGPDTECQKHTCSGTGQCATNPVANGTPVAAQIPADCKKDVCNGNGGVVTATDSTDVFVDGNECTSDACNGSTPSNPSRPANDPCSQSNGTRCNGSATAPACVQCLDDGQCGTDTACKTFSCSAGQCSSSNMTDGMLVTNAPPGNCHKDVCMTGNITTIVDNGDVPVDGNLCTDDVCSNGTPSNPVVMLGTNCGDSLMCNASGSCVGCILNSDCGTNTACKIFSCSTAGVCSFTNADAGTPVDLGAPGDCHANQCDANGIIVNAVNDNDKPSTGGNQCMQSLCTAGVPSTPLFGEGTTCSMNGGTMCNNVGACVECINATDCAGGPDTECHTRTCTNGMCDISLAGAGTVVSTQSSSPDCRRNVCDGNGLVTDIPDDTDVPQPTNECVASMCVAGVPMSPNKVHGTTCTVGGRTCDGGGSCVFAFDVVRVGDGVAALGNSAAAVVIEEHLMSTGAPVAGGALALPLSDTLPTRAFSLTGSGSGSPAEGELSLSVDGKSVVLAGYNRIPGTAGNLPNTVSTAVNRMVARIDGARTIDTSTTFGGSAFSGNNVRGVTTIDGTAYWGAGAGGTNAGIWYATSGASTSLQIFTTAIRWLNIYPNQGSNQLYGTGGNSPLTNVFTVGTGVPNTVGQTATTLTGMPNAATPTFSPHGFVLFDRDADGSPDLLYMADDGLGMGPNGATDRGIQKWTLQVVLVMGVPTPTWVRGPTFVDPGATPTGFRGLLGVATSATDITLIATTVETSANRIIKFVDTGSGTPTGTQIGAAGTNQVYRGVALTPHR